MEKTVSADVRINLSAGCTSTSRKDQQVNCGAAKLQARFSAEVAAS
jgi:hypothetical protein